MEIEEKLAKLCKENNWELDVGYYPDYTLTINDDLSIEITKMDCGIWECVKVYQHEYLEIMRINPRSENALYGIIDLIGGE